MFFAATTPTAFRRPMSAPSSLALERFLDQARRSTQQQDCSYAQDETAFTLSLDMPGVAKEQVAISIEGPVVRIHSKEGAPRSYKAAYELPQEIDATLSQAKLENGVLNLKLVKKVPVRTDCELVVH